MTDHASCLIGSAVVNDAFEINEIYNWYVQNSTITFDIEPWSVARRRQWLVEMLEPDGLNSVVTARLADELIGFAYNGPFRPRAAYRSSTEVTIYTHPDRSPPGIGGLLYRELFHRIGQTSLHRAYAGIALPNDRSIAFHKKFGFEYIGTLNEVGLKFNQRIDVAWYEKKLDTTVDPT